DCHTIGCLQCMHKCCTSPGTRPDLNPHRQVQGCRSHTDLACICIIGHSCSGAITYGLITLAC
ncbi:MAG: hypothetical protein Q8Q60_04285, partial [Candidatus Chromulinivorax sp.]|nr:hypothetical protein [Candidatus Chromulinivorax sp.]